jgi:multimeric flavodoxin WrbA
MKILGISCSPRVRGNTETMVQASLARAQEDGAEIDLVTLAGKTVSPCDGCYSCRNSGECHINDDMQDIYRKLSEADGIIFGTPVYFWDVSAQAKALIDRTLAVSMKRNLRNKAAGAVIAQGRNGSTGALATLHNFFIAHRMVIIGNAVGFGSDRGTVKEDETGMRGAEALGRAMVRYLNSGKL